MTSKNSIPTVWNGIQFRSRLEARWASFFTKLGWAWSYEPIDLDGYIPDFILHLAQDVMVEVKPFTRFEDPVIEDAVAKIQASGWDGIGTNHAVVVGARIFDCRSWPCRTLVDVIHRLGTGIVLGVGRSPSGDDESSEGGPWPCVLFECAKCGKPAFSVSRDTAYDSCCSCGMPTHAVEWKTRDRVFRYWTEAGNEVQWRGKQQNEEFVG